MASGNVLPNCRKMQILYYKTFKMPFPCYNYITMNSVLFHHFFQATSILLHRFISPSTIPKLKTISMHLFLHL